MPTYGNHELSYLRENLTVWKEKFRVPKGFSVEHAPALLTMLSGTENLNVMSTSQPSYYGFTIGSVRFLSILGVQSLKKRDLKFIPDDAIMWIEKELVTSSLDPTIKWIIPFFHASPFADGFSHPSVKVLRVQLGPLFQRYGVRIVLNAHDQSYERTLPLKIESEDVYVVTSQRRDCYDRHTNGTIYVKTSPGGKMSNIRKTFSKFQTDPPPAYTAFRDDNHHHVLQVRVEENGDAIVVKSWGLPGNGAPPTIMEEFRYTLGEDCDS
uniref:Acid phosphatase n=2 Tax=Lotharella oceanica TaxID=641309 RepID=A0A7S2TY24_9EUKA|mmetsp:Transcript_35110/g.65056  ORF Transcript_35110/g.65056 Transcript_35110/m.65056 type:complete len:267 (+) Transcript_35110:285-1085(+)